MTFRKAVILWPLVTVSGLAAKASGVKASAARSAKASAARSAKASAARSGRRKITYGGEVIQARTRDAVLELAQRCPSSLDVVKLLRRLVQLSPRNDDDDTIRTDVRLHTCLRALDVTTLAPDDLADMLWACAMLERPLRRSEVSVGTLVAAFDARAMEMELHAAGMAAWAWDSLLGGTPAPEALIARAAPLPFRVHIGAIDPTLLSLEALLAESAPRRDEIRSGSTEFTHAVVPESRLTAWQSDVNAPFTYSGKDMPPRVGEAEGAGMSPRIAQIRDELARSGRLERHYDSVLVNYYGGGKCGMRFHADPGQGDDGGWGYSTCVVSTGACRQFVFRRTGEPSQRCTFALRTGDVVEMYGRCQQDYQHSVKVEDSEEAAGPRISLVYKRRLERERALMATERPDVGAV